MIFNDTDHAALVDLADEAGIGKWDTYAALAEKVADKLEDLRNEVCEAETAADTARNNTISAEERSDDYEAILREICRTLSPRALRKPDEREVADLIASAREVLAQHGVTP